MIYNLKNTLNSNVIYNCLQDGNRESVLSGGKHSQMSQFYTKRKHKSISDLVSGLFSKNECTCSRVSMSAKVKLLIIKKTMKCSDKGRHFSFVLFCKSVCKLRMLIQYRTEIYNVIRNRRSTWFTISMFRVNKRLRRIITTRVRTREQCVYLRLNGVVISKIDNFTFTELQFYLISQKKWISFSYLTFAYVCIRNLEK